MPNTNPFTPALEKITNPEHLNRVLELIDWIDSEFPDLGKRIGWQQPIYTHHDTFILGLKPSKKHLSLNPEVAGIEHFSAAIKAAGYEHQTMTFTVPWTSDINYALLKDIITWQFEDKKDVTTFWRPTEK